MYISACDAVTLWLLLYFIIMYNQTSEVDLEHLLDRLVLFWILHVLSQMNVVPASAKNGSK